MEFLHLDDTANASRPPQGYNRACAETHRRSEILYQILSPCSHQRSRGENPEDSLHVVVAKCFETQHLPSAQSGPFLPSVYLEA